MPVKLNSSGGGSVTLTTPSTASNYTATFPATTGNVVLSDTSGTATVTDFYATNVYASGTVQMGSSFKRNRIINGDMRISQRGTGSTSVQTSTTYASCDRWGTFATQNSKFSVQQNAGSVTPPVGFSNYIGITSSSAYSVVSSDYFLLQQAVEGLNISDLAWGTANAKTVTVSFWVYSSLTGSFGACVTGYNNSLSYPFSYTISSANTWTYITVTIPGATTTTWASDNTGALCLRFSLGCGSTNSATANTWSSGFYFQPTGSVSVVGTNGATFYITGVQLEVGSVATPYERQIYSDQLAQCQRYYEQVPTLNTFSTVRLCISFTGSFCQGFAFLVPKRAAPTVTIYSRNGTANKVSNAANGLDVGTNAIANNVSVNSFQTIYDSTAPYTTGLGYEANYTASAEL